MELFIPVLFIALVVILARQVAVYSEWQLRESCVTAERQYETLLKNQKDLHMQKEVLESEADKIFTLYDMTREIAQKMHEEEAFQVFKSKLRAHVTFTDCQLVDARSSKVQEPREAEERFLFTLKEGPKKIAYLIFEGVPPDDEDKVMILSHQFALALRRVRLGAEIEKLAITDSLTDVYTRRHFMERLDEELKRSITKDASLSLLMIDVDYFKQMNDEHGHLTGDQALRGIAAVITENIREIDIAGRYGGEEFCVVLPETDRQGAQFAAERIRASIEKKNFKIYDTKLDITVSIGSATYPKDGQTTEELMDKADWALYRAKQNGRNCVCAFGVYSQ